MKKLLSLMLIATLMFTGNVFASDTENTNVMLRDSDNVQTGTSTNPVRVDPTGTTPQPISGSVSVSNFPATQTVAISQTSTNNDVDANITNASIAVTQSGTWTTGRTWTLSSGTDSISDNITQVGGASITLGQKTSANSFPVVIASNNTVAVSSTDLDIRDLSHSQDSVKIGDGVDFLAIAADGSIAVSKPAPTTQSNTFVATGTSTPLDVSTKSLQKFGLVVKGTGAVAGNWDVGLEGSLDGTNWTRILRHRPAQNDGEIIFSGANLFPVLFLRVNVSTLTLGGATNIVVKFVGME